ncbi:MAG: flagellar biosynthesis [Peptococcaceae bacterium]|nr:flagellar biosynthesis [Peptococcaceae bacterium]
MKKKEKPASSPDVAAALHYQSEKDSAPRVVATGKGDLAKKIKEIALKENVPIYQDTVLAQALVKLGAGTEIPEALYQAVAQILVHISRLDRKLKY